MTSVEKVGGVAPPRSGWVAPPFSAESDPSRKARNPASSGHLRVVGLCCRIRSTVLSWSARYTGYGTRIVLCHI